MEYESLDARGEGAVRWEEAGRPTVPSLALGDCVVPLLHVSQLARVLELPAPGPPPSALMAWETVGRLQEWLARLRPLDRATLTRPTPARARSLVNLTINVFHPFELLPRAWESGRFDWDPTRDDERERALASPEAVVACVSSPPTVGLAGCCAYSSLSPWQAAGSTGVSISRLRSGRSC